MTGSLVLICPGHTDPAQASKYIDGCGEVEAVKAPRRVDGKTQWVYVCPDCGARLLPTWREIERTRGGT